jgi:NADH dehydrogenase
MERGRQTPRVLVLGGRGFIGRHVVNALLARGADVVVGTRHPDRATLPCRHVGTRFERLQRAADWRPKLAGIEVVVNCVGILRRRGSETYERVHHSGPAALAAACRDAGLPLLHVSALGLENDCRSGFLRSKRAGESALRASGVRGAIVRPSLLDAPCGGFGAKWLRRVARWPVLALPADAVGLIAALDVRDLGDALAILALAPPPESLAEYEFGGTDAEPLRDYIARLRHGVGLAPARVLTIPGWLARAAAHACDALHVTPFSFGHWELLRRDNCPRDNHLPAVLGRPPRPIGGGVTESGHLAPAATPA